LTLPSKHHRLICVLLLGTITIESDLSVLTTAAAASHVVFTVTYTDDKGQAGSASAAADIVSVTP
jgi:hypothetical protein